MLLDEIETTFSGSTYPGAYALADEYPNEWESTLCKLQGKDWRTVVTSDFDSQGGVAEGVRSQRFHLFPARVRSDKDRGSVRHHKRPADKIHPTGSS